MHIGIWEEGAFAVAEEADGAAAAEEHCEEAKETDARP